MQLDVASATVLAAGVGAIVAGGVSALNTWLIRRSEERRQIRELAVRAAIEQWRFDASEIARRDIAGTYIDPLDSYLIHAMYFVRHLDGSLKTEKQIVTHIRKAIEISRVADQEIAKQSNQQKHK